MTIFANSSSGMIILLFSAAMLVLYLARKPAHKALYAAFIGLSNVLRCGARAMHHHAQALRERNREILLANGREQCERELSKEFSEISLFVQNDLGGYPKIQQDIRAQVNQLQEDYEHGKHSSVALPDWLESVTAVANLKQNAPAGNQAVLEQIHKSAQSQHKENLKAYRDESQKRLNTLQRCAPVWRKLCTSVELAGERLNEILTRAERIDKHMARYEALHTADSIAERQLQNSVLSQWLISALVIAIAAGAAFFNFHLIALPMSEMVGSVQRIGSTKVSDLAALVVICLEMCAGIFLLESLGVTKLFPLIGTMNKRTRRVIMITSAVVLVTLACTESALAYMRDQIAHDLSVLRVSLAGDLSGVEPIASSAQSWIPLAANMILGFILPIALTMIAIPLEYLLQSNRVVMGNIIVGFYKAFAVLTRLLSIAFRHLGKLLMHLYDLLIAGPLFVENLILSSRKPREESDSASHWLAQTQSNKK